MEGLEDDRINMIGICGGGGVGKTNLVEEVRQEAEYDNLFDKVAMARVSSKPKLKRIQDYIAYSLRLKFDWNDSAAGRAQQLFARLDDRKKRILVILDDIWEKVDLEAIGIPFGEEHEGCKVVLTSRNKNACEETGSEKDFSIEVLSEEEGRNLFLKLVGDSVDSPNQKNSAVECAGKCGGLPNAIVHAAREWRKRFYEVQDVQVAKAPEWKKMRALREEKFPKKMKEPEKEDPKDDLAWYNPYQAYEVEIEVVEEMFGLHPRVPSASVNNNDNSPHSFGSSTYPNHRGVLSTRCVGCQLIWARDRSMANYQKLLRGEHI